MKRTQVDSLRYLQADRPRHQSM